MSNLPFDLIANLAVFAATCLLCLCRNRMYPWLAPVSALAAYVVFATVALAFDAMLTFTVFADVKRYRIYAATDAFEARAASCVVVACAAAITSTLRRRHTARRSHAHADNVTIQTSPYSDSHLPM